MAMLLEKTSDKPLSGPEQMGVFVKPTKIIPWERMWQDSGIPHNVIFRTAALAFIYEADPENTEKAGKLADYLYTTPNAWNVFESMGRARIINTNVRLYDKDNLSGDPYIDSLITIEPLLEGGGP